MCQCFSEFLKFFLHHFVLAKLASSSSRWVNPFKPKDTDASVIWISGYAGYHLGELLIGF